MQVISRNIEAAALTDQQVIGMYGLQQSTQEAEEALSQGIEALNHSISETMASDLDTIQQNMTARMAHAINKLSTIEAFIRQVYACMHLFNTQFYLPIHGIWINYHRYIYITQFN